MSRKKISEYCAKTILHAALGVPYDGIEIDTADTRWPAKLKSLDAKKHYVVKVDQAEKGRFKKGLVCLNRDAGQVEKDIRKFKQMGYSYFLVEPYFDHPKTEERYLAIQRTREGNLLLQAASGGIDIEANEKQIKKMLYEKGRTGKRSGIPDKALDTLVQAFDDNYFSFLEINPLVIRDSDLVMLDAAVEVDGAAEFLQSTWSGQDIRTATNKSEKEVAVRTLNAKSRASFSLEALNPNGSIFLLLSGGGASVVVADEVHNLGYGKELANYGEYSGGPSQEETYLYTKQILQLLAHSRSHQKVLIIGGGVANFTDIRITFAGIIQALREAEIMLKKERVRIFVRRGGPFERQGLSQMRHYLDEAGIEGRVEGPEMMLSDIVKQAVDVLRI